VHGTSSARRGVACLYSALSRNFSSVASWEPNSLAGGSKHYCSLRRFAVDPSLIIPGQGLPAAYVDDCFPGSRRPPYRRRSGGLAFAFAIMASSEKRTFWVTY
jgi:hypothetical protein